MTAYFCDKCGKQIGSTEQRFLMTATDSKGDAYQREGLLLCLLCWNEVKATMKFKPDTVILYQ